MNIRNCEQCKNLYWSVFGEPFCSYCLSRAEYLEQQYAIIDDGQRETDEDCQLPFCKGLCSAVLIQITLILIVGVLMAMNLRMLAGW